MAKNRKTNLLPNTRQCKLTLTSASLSYRSASFGQTQGGALSYRSAPFRHTSTPFQPTSTPLSVKPQCNALSIPFGSVNS